MKSSLILIAGLLVVAPCIALSQPFGPPQDRRPGERIEQLKKVRLVEMLDLTEEQSVRFFARMNEFENQGRDLHKQKMELLDKVERLVRNDAEEKEFEKIFPEIKAVDEKILLEREKFFAGLSDLLNTQQRGKFLLFERQFERELREAMKEVRQRRHQRNEE